jgi:hypothetical protein
VKCHGKQYLSSRFFATLMSVLSSCHYSNSKDPKKLCDNNAKYGLCRYNMHLACKNILRGVVRTFFNRENSQLEAVRGGGEDKIN